MRILNGVDDWKAELSLGEVLTEALVLRVLFETQIAVVVAYLEIQT
jgi:hypothetical protein